MSAARLPECDPADPGDPATGLRAGSRFRNGRRAARCRARLAGRADRPHPRAEHQLQQPLLDNGRVTYRGAVEFDLRPSVVALRQCRERASGRAASAPRSDTRRINPNTSPPIQSGRRTASSTTACSSTSKAFYWDYTNQQVAHAGLDQLGRAGNFTQNIGSSRIYGAELETRVLVTKTTIAQRRHRIPQRQEQELHLYPGGRARDAVHQLCRRGSGERRLYRSTVRACRRTIRRSGRSTSPPSRPSRSATTRSSAVSIRSTGPAATPISTISRSSFQPASFVTTNAQIAFGPAKSDRWSIAGYRAEHRERPSPRSLRSPSFGLLDRLHDRRRGPMAAGSRSSSEVDAAMETRTAVGHYDARWLRRSAAVAVALASPLSRPSKPSRRPR